MKFKKVALALLLSALTTQADVIVWQMTQSGTLLGNLNNIRRSYTGYIVTDPDTGELQLIDVYTVGRAKYYEMETWTTDWFYLQGPSARAYTGFRVLISAGSTEGLTIGTGVDTTLKISKTRTMQMPRTFTCKPQAADIGSDNYGQVFDSTLTMSFSSKATLDANAKGQSVSDVIAALEAAYVAKGYALK